MARDNKKRGRVEEGTSSGHERRETNYGSVDFDALRVGILETVNASVDVALAEAKATAAKVTEEAERFRVETEKEREALEEEKVAMERAHTFQKSHVKLNVGGYRFETSVQTLTSVPDTYFASMFSGRFELTPLTSSSEYFIDRCGSVFHHVLDYMRDPASFDASCSDLTETEKKNAPRWRWFCPPVSPPRAR